MTPLPSIVKMKQEAIDQQEALHALKASVDTHWNQTPTKFTNPSGQTGKVPIPELHTDADVKHAASLMGANEWLAYDKKASEIASKYGVSKEIVKDAINKAHQENLNKTFVPVKPTSWGAGPTVASVAQSYGLQEAHLKGAQSLIEKHKAGQIADATYNTQMYKITKQAGVSKAQLEKAASELGSAPKGTVPKASIPKPTAPAVPTHITQALQLQKSLQAGDISAATYNIEMQKLGTSAGMGNKGMIAAYELQQAVNAHVKANPVVPKTTNPIPGLSGSVADKVAAMPTAKQDLIKLGAVYDQHGGTSSTYMTAIEAYNQKHGTSLTWSSAGPAVKEAKKEAGMIPAATTTGSGYKPTPATPTISKGSISNPSGGKTELAGSTYAVVSGQDESRNWGNKHFAQWRSTLTSGEQEAFIGYSKHGDGPINNFLRHGTQGNESDSFSPQKPSTVTTRIKHLDDAIAKTSLPENVMLVRGFNHKGFVDRMASGQDLTGAVFHDNAFVSTSINSQGGFSGSIKMRIHAPKGSKGAYMDGNMKLTKFPGEQEILLGRDSNFRIKGYKKVGGTYGHWEVDVEYLGTGPLPTSGTSFKAEK
jgi:hypothetical protein